MNHKDYHGMYTALPVKGGWARGRLGEKGSVAGSQVCLVSAVLTTTAVGMLCSGSEGEQSNKTVVHLEEETTLHNA